MRQGFIVRKNCALPFFFNDFGPEMTIELPQLVIYNIDAYTCVCVSVCVCIFLFLWT